MIAPSEILAGMVKAPSVLPSGAPLISGGLDTWIGALLAFKGAGFHGVELHDNWLPFPSFDHAQIKKLTDALTESVLEAPAFAIARKSVIEPGLGEANLSYTLRGLEVAHELGASTVCLGLHPMLTAEQKDARFFWLAAGRRDSEDQTTWLTAVKRLQKVANRAGDLGLLISLEFYEDTLLGSPESALRLVADINASHVGLNPDIGNLIRLDREVDHWRQLLGKMLPVTNYWHVKNYTREMAGSSYITNPTSLEHGVIDYPEALEMAELAGFTGRIVCEQYSDDWLEVLLENRMYLEGLLTKHSPSSDLGATK
jgi:sugar phosphate isomerase/epimerase